LLPIAVCPTLFDHEGPVFLLIHLLTTLARLFGPGDATTIVADRLLMKQQLLVVSRS